MVEPMPARAEEDDDPSGDFARMRREGLEPFQIVPVDATRGLDLV
jgi:hypothetical protein